MVDPAVPVTFVSSHAQLGGSELALERLLDSLGEAWCAGIICLQDGPLVDRLRSAGRQVSVVPTGTSALAVGRSARRVRPMLQEATVVHANGVKAALVCALAAVPTRRYALLWNKHDFSFDGWVGRAVAHRCTCVVGVSRTVLAGLKIATDTAVIPPAVAIPAAPPDSATFLRQTLRAPAHAPVVLLVGRLDVAKGHRQLLDVMPRLIREIPELIIGFVGGDEPSQPGYKDQLAERADALGVRDRIRMLGHRHDAQRLIAGADVVAVLSHPVSSNGMGQEGFGMVAVEALSSGTPVVAYDAGAVPEVVGDAAMLVAVGDKDGLVKAIVDVLRDDHLRADLRARGRQRVKSFSLDLIAGRWRELYVHYAAGKEL